MTSSDRRAELQNLLFLLADASLTLITRPVVVTGSKPGPQRVTWPRTVAGVGELYRTPFATVREYREWVESDEYSAVLFDGSLIQLSFDFLGNEVVSHRLVYFPCPF